jgi:hypothetical protein
LEEIKKKITVVGAISVGVTWVYGNVLFKPEEKWAKAIYGICHYSERIFLFTPKDYEKPIMIVTLEVSPMVSYCEKSKVCVYFDCPLNRFTKDEFFGMFKECGGFSLGMPKNFGNVPLWFNDPLYTYARKWKYFILDVTGGIIAHKDDLHHRSIT